MDTGTLAALLVGAAISIASTFAATAGTEFFKEWRNRKRLRTELEDERILSIQNDLVRLGLSIKALQWEHKHPVISRIARPERADQLVREAAAYAASIAVTATRLTDDEARAIAKDIRAASRKLVAADKKRNFIKGAEEFMTQMEDANERLGALVRRRME